MASLRIVTLLSRVVQVHCPHCGEELQWVRKFTDEILDMLQEGAQASHRAPSPDSRPCCPEAHLRCDPDALSGHVRRDHDVRCDRVLQHDHVRYHHAVKYLRGDMIIEDVSGHMIMRRDIIVRCTSFPGICVSRHVIMMQEIYHVIHGARHRHS